jgi:hypothetical protein
VFRLNRRRVLASVPAAGMLLGGLVLSGCSTAQPSAAQCAIVTGHGLGSDQAVKDIAHPGEKVHIGNGDITWYVPCDARNYVTAPSGGDRSNPESVRTGPGSNGQEGMPVQVWSAVYWQLNQSNAALKAFLPFCLKYGCAATTDQTDNSNQNQQAYSTPGWNGMLRENFGPALDRATLDAITQFGPTLWQDQSQWPAVGRAIAADFNAQVEEATGSKVPFFCGDASTESYCAPVQVVVNNVTPTDPGVVAQYNQQILSQSAEAANAARLRAAQQIYGPYANYFLGIQDTEKACPKGCVIYIGSPSSIPQG